MFGIDNISLDFLTSVPWLVWPALGITVALAIFLYINTNPPVPRPMRFLLSFLRSLALVALGVALLEMVVGVDRVFDRNPKIAVLIDRSGSMDKSENNLSRALRLDSLLASEDFARIENRADISIYYFGGNLSDDMDKIERESTALGEACSELSRLELGNNSDHWILFSDGRSNSGRGAKASAGDLSSPVLCIDLAETVGSFDVGLGLVDFNPIMFVGQKSEIKVNLKWENAGGRTIEVRLVESGRDLAHDRLHTDIESGFGEITLELTPSQPGQKFIEVEAVPLDGELTTDNNRRSIAIKVLRSRLSVLLVSARPDYEIGFMKRFFDKSEKYDVDLCLLGAKSGNLKRPFPSQQSALNKYDLVILHDIDVRLLNSREPLIKSYLADRGGSLWVMMGKRFARVGSVPWFDGLMPFYLSRPTAIRHIQFRGEPSESDLFHPAVRLADNQESIRKAWAEVPPFQALVPCDMVDPQARILAHASVIVSNQGRPPIFGYKSLGPGKVFATSALPFWTWGFVNIGFGEDGSVWNELLNGVSSWLTTREDFDPIHIKPEKEVFHRGDIVRFEAVAFDQGFRPLPDVTGQVRLKRSGEQDVESDLVAVGQGRYRAEFLHLPSGRYDFIGTLTKDGRQLKEVRGQIVIESFTLEEFDRSGNPAELIALASGSGGAYFRYHQFGEAMDALDLKKTRVSISSDTTVWNSIWLLIVILSALSLEWVLRKVYQLL